MSRPEYPIFDGHNDTLLSLHLDDRDGGRSFFVESDTGHIDLPRARRGGLAGGFFAVCVPPVKTAGGRTVRRADGKTVRRADEKGGRGGQTGRRAGGQADEKTRRFDRPRPSLTATGSPIAALDPAYALRFTEEVVAGLRRLINDANGQVRLVPTVNNLTQCLELDVLAIVLHFEGAELSRSRHPGSVLSAGTAIVGDRVESAQRVWSRGDVRVPRLA
jgi:membrane dipeptidase